MEIPLFFFCQLAGDAFHVPKRQFLSLSRQCLSFGSSGDARKMWGSLLGGGHFEGYGVEEIFVE